MNHKLHKFSRELPLHLFLLPGLVVIIIYSYVPMAGLVMAFQKFTVYSGWFSSKWVGLDNFRFVLQMPDFMHVLWNTVFIACMKIVALMVIPIVLALMLNEVTNSSIKKVTQTLVYLPHFLSWVILSGILIDILSPSDGIVNAILKMGGIKPIFFLENNSWFPSVLIFSEVWKEAGFNTIIYLAAITSINVSQYEAAEVDGANRWQQTIFITLPGMLPIIVLLASLSLGNVLNAGFDQVYNLLNPLVYKSGDIIDTLVYRIAFTNAQYSVATAIGLFKSVVSLVLMTLSYFLAYRYANYRIF